MKGRLPKPAALRQRRNKKSTASQLETDEEPRVEAPELGDHPSGQEWHPRTRSFWAEVWASPMAKNYLRADEEGLLQLAILTDAFWKQPDAKLAAEIRLQRQAYGLTPLDRSRLQWETVRGEEAERKRRPPSPPESKGRKGDARLKLA